MRKTSASPAVDALEVVDPVVVAMADVEVIGAVTVGAEIEIDGRQVHK